MLPWIKKKYDMMSLHPFAKHFCSMSTHGVRRHEYTPSDESKSSKKWVHGAESETWHEILSQLSEKKDITSPMQEKQTSSTQFYSKRSPVVPEYTAPDVMMLFDDVWVSSCVKRLQEEIITEKRKNFYGNIQSCTKCSNNNSDVSESYWFRSNFKDIYCKR